MSMKKCLVSALLVMSLTVPVAWAGALDEAFVEDTRGYFTRLEKLGFSGVLLLAEGGKPVLIQGLGLADREQGTRWEPATISTIGSITKQFTAAAILKLQEKGLLDVQDPIGKHFDDVPADKDGITLHHLLTHSSGIVDPPGIGDFDPISRDEYVLRIFDAPLASNPGERYEYSNANYSLLGAVIEKVTGLSYETAMRELIFKPAGLEDTGYLLPRFDRERLAQGYSAGEKWGTVLERPMAEDGPYWALRANGGIHSTSLDMLRWAQALLDDRVLSPASREALWTPHVDESNGAGESYYGYGWAVLEPSPGVRVITHNGGNGIHFAELAVIPDREIVAFLQTNVVADFGLANHLLTQVSERLFGGKAYPRVPQVEDVAPEKLAAWAGTYRLDNEETLEVTANGKVLRVVPRGWTAYACVHGGREDMNTLKGMSREIDRIVGAYTKGDFKPLFEAYRSQVPLERLQENYANREKERVQQFGAFKGYEVLGTGSDDGRHLTAIRFEYERDDVVGAYVWDRADGRLLGMTTRRVDPGCLFFPVAGGRFESFDPASGAFVPARFEISSGGKAVIAFGEADREIRARR